MQFPSWAAWKFGTARRHSQLINWNLGAAAVDLQLEPVFE